MSTESQQPGQRRTDAYHGTNLDNYWGIVQTGFRPSLGICGNAAYFDLGNRDSAVAKALEKAGQDVEQAVVIQAEWVPGKTVEINFQHNLLLAQEFQVFQAELVKQHGRPLPFTFNEQKEMFLEAYYPDTDTVLYTVSEGNAIAGVRDPSHIRIVSAETLAGRRLS
jgi:hypothetical protein